MQLFCEEQLNDRQASSPAAATATRYWSRPDYQAASVTVRAESLIAPPSWHDVDLASGEWQLRKQQLVPGYDPTRYGTVRIAVPAEDGTQIPVTLACRAGFRRDGTSPCPPA